MHRVCPDGNTRRRRRARPAPGRIVCIQAEIGTGVSRAVASAAAGPAAWRKDVSVRTQ